MKLESWGLIAGIATTGIIAGGNCDRVGAVTTVLYDSSSGTTPNAISNPYLTYGSTGGSQSFVGGLPNVTNLNTSGSELPYAGYSNYNPTLSLVNPAFPILDNNAGYTLSFTMRVKSQTNNDTNGANRAGFSVTILGSDRTGIEIGFRNPNTQGGGTTADIFALNGNGALFTKGEDNNSIGSILSSLNTYDLSVLGSNYTLKTGSTTLLTGILRSYTGGAIVGTPTAVYGLSNFLFLGDNTTSAGASVDIANITLVTNSATAVPEPSNLWGIGMAIGLGATLKRKLHKLSK